MKFNIDILYNWYRNFNITDDEKKLLTENSELKLSDNFNLNLNNEFLSILNSYNLTNEYKVSVDSSATTIIDSLFNKYVTDDTLVITTSFEHPSVLNNLNKCKNVFRICSHNEIFIDELYNVLTNLDQYKNVFVYINRVPIISNIFIPIDIIKTIKKLLILSGINHYIVIDDVQGMHMFPCDYSVADNIIGTAHASINKKYNMGILISKTDYVKFDKKGIRKYLDIIKIQNRYLPLIYQFSMVMTSYYFDLLKYSYYFELSNRIPYKFYIIDKLHSTESNLSILIQSEKNTCFNNLDFLLKLKGQIFQFSDNSFIRATHCLINFDHFINCIEDINLKINNIIGN